MKNKMTKCLSFILANAIVVTTIPAFANEYNYKVDENDNSVEEIIYQSTADDDFENESAVYLQIGSRYEVTIPKTIVLSGASKKANYYVKVKGDIAGNKAITVTPSDTITLYSNNKNAQTGIISQDKKSWTYQELGIDANGNISANGITAGKWSGNFDFNIDFEDIETHDIYEKSPIEIALDKDHLAQIGYSISNYKLYKNGKETSELIIPSEYVYENETYEIKKIDYGTFSRCYNLESITIPESVVSIGNRAFEYCRNLKQITIPDNVTNIGSQAFYGCENLSSINLGDGVCTLGNNAFYQCNNLRTITIGKNLKDRDWGREQLKLENIAVSEENPYYSVVDNVLYNKNKTELILYAGNNMSTSDKTLNYSIMDGVKKIRRYAFYYRGFNTITIPDSVVEIEDNAFYSTKNKVVIGKGLKTASGHTFDCNIRNPDEIFVVDNDNPYICSMNGVIFSKDKTKLLAAPAMKGSYSIPSGTEIICSSAFYSTNLTTITFPNTLTTIENSAFYFPYNLTAINIPSVKYIGYNAFQYCDNAKTVVIGNNIEHIGSNAFLTRGTITSFKYKGTNYTDRTALNNRAKSDGVATGSDIWVKQ